MPTPPRKLDELCADAVRALTDIALRYDRLIRSIYGLTAPPTSSRRLQPGPKPPAGRDDQLRNGLIAIARYLVLAHERAATLDLGPAQWRPGYSWTHPDSGLRCEHPGLGWHRAEPYVRRRYADNHDEESVLTLVYEVWHSPHCRLTREQDHRCTPDIDIGPVPSDELWGAVRSLASALRAISTQELDRTGKQSIRTACLFIKRAKAVLDQLVGRSSLADYPADGDRCAHWRPDGGGCHRLRDRAQGRRLCTTCRDAPTIDGRCTAFQCGWQRST